MKDLIQIFQFVITSLSLAGVVVAPVMGCAYLKAGEYMKAGYSSLVFFVSLGIFILCFIDMKANYHPEDED